MTDVIRPKTIYTDEQKRLLATAIELAQAAEAAETAAWEAIKAARDARVLDTDLTGDDTPARFNRATLNRRYGARPS
ncbi:hypothetical protein ABZ738_05420 [Micromonospora sp. NPDC047793]|uniref:hypothetical protein n=1 Tax=Micromonospora sp. NPDC047793 TaxID=3154342 RepID=UPI0033D0355B